MDKYNISDRYTVPSVSSLSLISTLRMWNFSFSLKSPVGYVTEDLLMFGLHRMIRPSNKNTCLSVGLPFACFIRTPSGKVENVSMWYSVHMKESGEKFCLFWLKFYLLHFITKLFLTVFVFDWFKIILPVFEIPLVISCKMAIYLYKMYVYIKSFKYILIHFNTTLKYNFLLFWTFGLFGFFFT